MTKTKSSAPEEKKERPKWTWREYLLQLSVVIVGIMVTFIGSDLIARWSRQKQVKAVMQLVSEELKQNRNNLEFTTDILIYDHHGMLLIQKYKGDLDAIPADSLKKYEFVMSRLTNMTLQNDALEVLKSSGLISSVGDKSLLMTILKCYSALGSFRNNVSAYSDFKMNAANHLIESVQDFEIADDDPRALWKAVMADPVCAGFIHSAVVYFGGTGYFTEIRNGIDTTIADINKKYGFDD